MRAEEIYERSVKLALADWPESLDNDGDGVMWLTSGSRGLARAWYANEFGVPFTRVRATREWLAPNLDYIHDMAYDLAAEDPDNLPEEPVAYTWDGEAFLWSHAPKDAPGAKAFWRCEEAM